MHGIHGNDGPKGCEEEEEEDDDADGEEEEELVPARSSAVPMPRAAGVVCK
jgi:hypothetical protein